MADVIKKSTNKFTKGLVMDFSPENTRNEVLTHALNATLITFNGNELSLQNDMGNARVETAFLPEGYIPVGTCEYGGIIYIVSYNPLEDKSQIGCFPSPERNVSNDELGISDALLRSSDFQDLNTPGTIKNNSQCVLLKEDSLNPGDKFLVYSDGSIFNENLKDLYIKDSNNTLEPIANPILALNIVSIEDSGRIVYLNSDLRQYEVTKQINNQDTTYSYHILGKHTSNESQFDSESVDIDNYRNVLSSGYNVFKSKTSGKLALLAELIMIDSYSVTHSLHPKKDLNGNSIEGAFDLLIHTEVSPQINSANFRTAPKLKYYYLQNSQGYLQTYNGNVTTNIPLIEFDSNSNSYIYNQNFSNTKLDSIYLPTSEMTMDLDVSVGNSGTFTFPLPDTYHGRIIDYTGSLVNVNQSVYTQFYAKRYHRISKDQIQNNSDYFINNLNAKFYYYDDSEQEFVEWKESQLNSDYIYYIKEDDSTYRLATDIELKYESDTLTFYYLPAYKLIADIKTWNSTSTLFVVIPKNSYVSSDYFLPNTSDNYIREYNQPSGNYSQAGEYPISLHTIDEFIPNEEANYEYESVKLASINFPSVVVDNQLNFPFKYNYTIVPCMNYGKLDHLAVSNTVDLSNLHSFNQSNFNTWKYHIDGNQLRLTFGAEIFDTYEENKVNGLVLEFYDLWGFAGSLEITDKKSYSGIFTKILQLNTVKTLSKKRINGENYSETFSRNVNIAIESNQFKLNGREITFNGYVNGWGVSEDENDCGVLYSNMIYGVKAYLRQNSANGYKFTKKKEFWLYTLPIFNEHYYTISDFSNIHNPQLDFVLTYKLSDKSKSYPYETEEIKNGYTPTDASYIALYKDGQYKGSSLSGIRYYIYKGISNLSLEVGLMQDYQKLNVSYDPIINNFFKCSLNLVSDTDANNSVSIKSNSSIENLNYNNNDNIPLTTSLNHLSFDSGNVKNIEVGDFASYNFIHNIGTKVIPITYEFVVGYTYNISEITKTEVPMTTVCALLHKDDRGQENLDDFGLRIIAPDSNSEDVVYTSNATICNGGTKDLEILEIVSHQTTLDSDDASTQLYKRASYEQKSVKHSKPALLNTGDPLKFALDYIGKLTFIQPHAHLRDKNNGVNVYYGLDKDANKYSIPPEWVIEDGYGDISGTTGDDSDDAKGCIPKLDLYNSPCYNLMVNTLDSINQTSECISTNDYSVVEGKYWLIDLNKDKNLEGSGSLTPWAEPMREFVGFKASQLSTFYKKFVNTMRNVYAYNPDYDTLPVQTGKLSVESNPVTFSSNLLSKDSSFVFDPGYTLNDYVCLGSMSITNYLNLLKAYSVGFDGSSITIKENVDGTDKFIPQIQFVPNLAYCGESDSPYLLTNLNYNTEVPNSATSDLDITSFNKVCVKKADGSNVFITGSINKQALYGLQNDKLVQLDVSNYTISDDGNLNLKDVQGVGESDVSLTINSNNAVSLISNNGYYTTQIFEDKNKIFDTSTVDIIANLNLHEGYLPNSYDPETNSIVICAKAASLRWANPKISASSSADDGYGYSVLKSLAHINGEIKACHLNSGKITLNQVKQLSASTLRALITGDEEEFIFITPTSNSTILPRAIITPNPELGGIVRPGTFVTAIKVGDCRHGDPFSAQYSDSLMRIQDKLAGMYDTLYLIPLSAISFSLTRTTGIQNYDASVIPVNRTDHYSDTIDHKYTVFEKYQGARIRGTSITLNDLYYDPSEKHRLYMRRHLYKYDTETYRGRLFYRSMTDKMSWSGVTKTKTTGQQNSTTNYMNYNSLYLHTGPCFTYDNL